MPNKPKEQAPFDERISSECMRNERIAMNCRDKKLELQFTSMPDYLQASMIPKDQLAIVSFTATGVRFLGGIVCMVATVS